MNRITITINTKNAAFDENENLELARILKELSERIENNDIPRSLLDINGNKVGTIETE